MKRKLPTPDRAAYAASEALYETLSQAPSKLEAGTTQLQLARTIAQRSHLGIDKRAARQVLGKVLAACSAALATYHAVLLGVLPHFEGGDGRDPDTEGGDIEAYLRDLVVARREAERMAGGIERGLEAMGRGGGEGVERGGKRRREEGKDGAAGNTEVSGREDHGRVRYEDVTEEVDARIKARQEREEKAKKTDKKRKRESRDSLASVSERTEGMKIGGRAERRTSKRPRVDEQGVPEPSSVGAAGGRTKGKRKSSGGEEGASGAKKRSADTAQEEKKRQVQDGSRQGKRQAGAEHGKGPSKKRKANGH